MRALIIGDINKTKKKRIELDMYVCILDPSFGDIILSLQHIKQERVVRMNNEEICFTYLT